MIVINVKTRHSEVTRDEVVRYFAHSFTAQFSLDGNADTALMMAGDCLQNIGRAHRGDVLLVEVRINGRLVLRYVGEANSDDFAQLGEFIEGGARGGFDFVARRIAQITAHRKDGIIADARELAACEYEEQASDMRAKYGEASELAAMFMIKARNLRQGKMDRDFSVQGRIATVLAVRRAAAARKAEA